jgi:iron complex outermembrane receptor protein
MVDAAGFRITLSRKFASSERAKGELIMRFSSFKPTYWVAAALSVSLAAPGFAQAPAQSGASQDEGLTEIVVTARRTEERLQDVPISITVFNQAQIEDRNVSSIEDLAAYTPSLSAPATFGSDNAAFAIRGFVQAGNTTPSVGVFFADVAAPHSQGQLDGGNGAGPGAFFDLSNVQVLKGPQGTLFGRNTTGGDILLVPQKPTGEFGGFVEQSVGNYAMERTQAVLNVPLNDQIRVRLGVDHETRNGYLNNISGIGPDNFGDVDYTSVRASVVVDVTPNLENYTIASWSESNTNGDYPKAFGYVAADAGLTSLLANIPAQIAATNGNFWNVENGNPFAKEVIQQWRVINTTTWTATDLLSIKNIASYSQFEELHNSNIFGESGAPGLLPIAPGTTNYVVSVVAAPGSHDAAEQTVTEELQLHGRTQDSRLTYQSGLYLELNMPLNGFQSTEASSLLNCGNLFAFQCTDVAGNVLGFPLGSTSLSSTQYHFRDLAVYSQANYKITDQLTLTAGARYTHDDSSGLSQDVSVHYPTANTQAYSCSFVPPLTAPATSAAILSNPALCDVRGDQASHAPTWMVDLEYKPIDSLMLYVKESRGYREGNVDVSQYGLSNWKPEKVDTYEIGSKMTFDGIVHGAFDFAAFYNDFRNQQLAFNLVTCEAIFLPQCPFIPASAAGIGNAGKSRIEGLELDSSITPFPAIVPLRGLRFDVGYTYLETKLLAITPPPIPVGFTALTYASIVGGPLQFSPKNKVSLTGNYKLPLDASIGSITLAATYTYQSSEYNTNTAPPGFETLSSQENLNLNLNWNNIVGTPLDLSLFATNVTDRKYYLATAGTFQNFGYDVAYLNQPTMYGARLRYRFGH